jgi:hypothetical protein
VSSRLSHAGVYDVAGLPDTKGFLLQGVNRSDDMDKRMVRRFDMQPNTAGHLWLLIGGHSGHGGLDEFYITQMQVAVRPI